MVTNEQNIQNREDRPCHLLDPLATGLLIIYTGKMTKQIDSYQAQEKEYTEHLRSGKQRPHG